MAIPKYHEFFLPVLKRLADGKEHSVHQLYNWISADLKLTTEDLHLQLPSGKQAIFDNRIGWAGTYLKMAGLIARPRRGVVIITERGRDVLRQNLPTLSVEFLMQYPEFANWLRGKESEKTPTHTPDLTPREALEQAFGTLRSSLADEVKAKIHECSPSFFERLVVAVLVKMGYGGSFHDAAQAVGGSGDGGIDGVIKEDPLGLDVIYIQAKRWEGVVGRPEIQKFTGALAMHRAKKGIFVTTSSFTKDALEYVKLIDQRIVLVDGAKLADLMITYDLGVTQESVFEIKRIDSDYFAEE